MTKEEFLKLFKGSVEIDVSRRGGQPVIKGTRFPISQLVTQAAEDYADKFIDEFNYDPKTTGKDIKLFFKCLSQMFVNPPIKEP